MSVVAVSLLGAKVYADTAADIEQFYPVGSYAIYDNASGDYPVITAVGSMPGTFGGHVYTGWSVFAQDATGSLDLFVSASTLTTLTHNASATLSVGDALNAAGQWSPFHKIPELAFVTTPASNNYVTTISTGNALPTPPVFTISQLNQGNINDPTIPLNQAGYYLEIDNVKITSAIGRTDLPSYTTSIPDESFTITDATGSMIMFDWTTSYSAATLLAGTPIGDAYTYNLRGFLSVNPGGPMEFTAFQVPEPSTVALVASGLLGLLTLRRRRS